MSRSKNLAIKYLMAAVLFFGVMTLSGLMSAFYYINPDFLFGLVHFNIAKILHIDTMIIWLLMGFMGAVYWFLPEEFGREPTGIGQPRFLFWVFVAAVLVVAAIFLFVKSGPATETTLWLFQQGRKVSSRRPAGPRSAWPWSCLSLPGMSLWHGFPSASHHRDHGGDEREHGAARAPLSRRVPGDR